ATRAMLERTLMNHFRRARRTQPDLKEGEIKAWIEAIAESFIQKGYVNDNAWAEATLRQARKSGWSKQKIAQKMYSKGISQSLIRDLQREEGDSEDFHAAVIYARRKALGPWRKNEAADKQKEMEKLCRAGFAPEIARKITRLSLDQAEDVLEEARTK
ncbi:MAG TPA: RecX family transcriptional regulator, partial [Alphaproteobacteria bacterium]|nr:RecX family transcriptional regulator [Alphaproteobacteria bacterium]